MRTLAVLALLLTSCAAAPPVPVRHGSASWMVRCYSGHLRTCSARDGWMRT